MIEINKTCNCCKMTKDINQFSKKYKTKDGIQKYQSLCKSCVSIKDKERSSTVDYKLKKKKYDSLYYEQNHEKILERKKEYHIENRTDILIKKQEYRDIEENNERMKKYMKKYKIENKEKYYKYRKTHPHIIAWRRILYRTLYYLGKEKEGKTVEILGYSAVQLKHHLEKLWVLNSSIKS